MYKAAECGTEIVHRDISELLEHFYSSGVTNSEYNALCDPVSRTNAEIAERLFFDGMKLYNKAPSDASHVAIEFERHGQAEDSSTVFVRSCTLDQLSKVVNVPLKSSTNHGFGADGIVIKHVSHVNRKIDIELHQVKLGKTPIGCATTGSNHNSSMVAIGDKLENLSELIEGTLDDQFDCDTQFTFVLDTTRPLRGNAVKEADRRSITINDHAKMWPIWTPEVRRTLTCIYGSDHASMFGPKLK